MGKNITYQGLDNFNDLIYLRALTDEQIAERARIATERISVYRRALGIEEVKKQIIPFQEK